MSRYQCLLFDADNTLFDFDLAQSQSLEKAVFQACGSYKVEWLDTYCNISKSYWDRFESGEISVDDLKRRRFEDFVDQLDLQVCPDTLNKAYISHLSSCTMLVADCERILQHLSQAGFKLAIVTNGLSMIQRSRFKAATITHHFQSVIISDEVGFAKPDPRIFECAMESIAETDYSRTLMVGDNLKSDIHGGNQFGLDTCWFNPDRKLNQFEDIKPNHEVQRLEQLLDIVN